MKYRLPFYLGRLLAIGLVLFTISVEANNEAGGLLQKGFELRKQAYEMETTANGLIAAGTAFVRDTAELRALLAKSSALKHPLNQHVSASDYPADLYLLSERSSANGAELRNLAVDLYQYSTHLMNLGFYTLWSKHVGATDVTHIRGTGSAAAHSELMQMTFTSQNRPDDLDLTPGKPSSRGLYYAHMQSTVDEVVLNQIHSWKIILVDARGKGVVGAKLRLRGEMPSHLHGLATKPSIEETNVAGIYQVNGMKFQMRGWWTLQLEIETKLGKDEVTYNMDL